PSLHENDFNGSGFEWINADDAENSVISYLRKAGEQSLIVIMNFTPVPRESYALGVSNAGDYAEIFNSDSQRYSGTNVGNKGLCQTTATPCMGRENTITLNLPPLGAVILKHQP
ncbi:MAG: alpha amylase C-terminal domain-containing protein, partial [Pseudomonadota bacterium]